MVLLAWAVVGVIFGAVGSEILRATRPRLVKKVEDAAKRFADSMCPPESDAEQTEKKHGSDDAPA
jgi:hypothetical protein